MCFTSTEVMLERVTNQNLIAGTAGFIITHTIHVLTVWHIYLHLVDFDGKHTWMLWEIVLLVEIWTNSVSMGRQFFFKPFLLVKMTSSSGNGSVTNNI